MFLPWSKPLAEVTCPICGTRIPLRRDKNTQFQPKPHCDHCGWNIARSRKLLFVQIGQHTVAAALFALYTWAATGMMWIALLVAGWMLIVMGLPIFAHLWKLPQARPMPQPQPLTGVTDFRTVTLGIATPRLNIVVEGLIVVISATALLFVPKELNPARRLLPKLPHVQLFVILTTMFAAYQLVVHLLMFFRLVRSIQLERHLAKRAMVARGRITNRNSARITYEFLDHASRPVPGVGRDYTMGLYEDMLLPVLYDPDEPSLNMPVAGLQFHRTLELDESQRVVLQER